MSSVSLDWYLEKKRGYQIWAVVTTLRERMNQAVTFEEIYRAMYGHPDREPENPYNVLNVLLSREREALARTGYRIYRVADLGLLMRREDGRQ